jgi:hypothetical protein
MPHLPFSSVDESSERLRGAGWSVGETAGSAVWIITGTNGENVIQAEGRTQAGAWYRATLQAEAVGMLAPPKGSADHSRF